MAGIHLEVVELEMAGLEVTETVTSRQTRMDKTMITIHSFG